MNQKYLILKSTESAGVVTYSCVDTITCERSEARQSAADKVEDIGDGTFYVVPLGDKIVATTKRVIEGVKSTRKPAEKTAAKVKQPKKKRGLADSAKLAPKGGDDIPY